MREDASFEKMLQLLSLSSLLGLALSVCNPPPAPTPAPTPSVPLVAQPLPNGHIMYSCPEGFYAYGNFGPGGTMLYESPVVYECDPAVGKIFVQGKNQESALTTITCTAGPAESIEYCVFSTRPNDVSYAMVEGQQATLKCPAGYRPELSMVDGGKEVMSFSCNNQGGAEGQVGKFKARLIDGTEIVSVGKNLGCEKVPTTTSTTTTTTTVKPDSPATASQLWNVNYYYNYGFGVHAFCADSTCINAIQSNGIGYDMNNGWGLMGRAVSESMINSVRASCPTGSGNLRNLGFTKSGNKYLHNLNGSGLKCGWVSIASGSCGARVVIKRWKSRYTDDMMYGVDLEWNTWYQGMVQDGGLPQFYMWD